MLADHSVLRGNFTRIDVSSQEEKAGRKPHRGARPSALLIIGSLAISSIWGARAESLIVETRTESVELEKI